jgi:hypothetical protein
MTKRRLSAADKARIEKENQDNANFVEKVLEQWKCVKVTQCVCRSGLLCS